MQTDNTEHQKRFGQFFSGEMVAEKLVSLLPNNTKISTVIDPMAGIGDMLRAVKESRNDGLDLVGIEIDKPVFEQCNAILPKANIVLGDAFISEKVITSQGWDLVITNPPYVRYQLQTDNTEGMPTGKEIRDNLIARLKTLNYLTEEELELFISIAENYSGLSDMAVPSWILCSALVKKGGYLAIVVPETWLNRDYAAPIQYLLGKCFKIKDIAKETNERWFKNALVKTSLVVAERCDIRPISLLDKEMTRVHTGTGIQECISSQLFHSTLQGINNVPTWAQAEDVEYFQNNNIQIPIEMLDLIADKLEMPQFTNLHDMGIECGQGLRTGANDFFYLNIIEADQDMFSLRSKDWDGEQVYHIPIECVKKTLQNRNQVRGLVVDREILKTALLYLQSPMNEETELQEYIERANSYRNNKGKRFRELSAVKPNERTDLAGNKRFWYMLPSLSRRHLPDLCMTRINSNTTECIFVGQNYESPTVVDANFTTLWGENSETVFLTYALLNSTWCKCFLECSCTIMGAGALKVEANHLKKMQIPLLESDDRASLIELGKRLKEERRLSVELQNRIDLIICRAFQDEEMVDKLRRLLCRKYSERGKRK